MPTISIFYGIIISLYFYDNERHNLPHIHAKYQGQNAVFSILDGELLSGEIPLSKAKLCRRGLKSGAKTCWQTGNWRSMASHFSL